MLQTLFSNRLFLGMLVLLVLLGVVSTIYFKHVERQTQQAIQRAEASIARYNARNAEDADVSADVTSSQGGDINSDGTLPADLADTKPRVESPKPSAPQPLDSSGERLLTKEEEAEMRKYWADIGLEPPPRGYGYQWDENGNVSLYQYNVPEFELKWSEKEYPGQDYSKLSDIEWQRYRALEHIISQNPLRLTQEHEKMLKAGAPFPTVNYAPGVVELAKERLAELNWKAAARTPRVSTTVTWNRPPTNKELEAIARKEFELLESLEKPERTPPVAWRGTFLDALIKELEAEVQRR